MSSAKTQAESAMAIRSDWMQLPVFVAQPLEHRKTIKGREERQRENDFAIETFRTLSEEP
jgi:hypothetical protein